EIQEAILLDRNGQVVAVSEGSLEDGKDYSQREEYLKALDRDFISDVKKEENADNHYLTISVPFLDAERKQFQGVLIGKINSKALSNIVAEKVDLGGTGEIFLLNGEKKFITPAKYLDRDVILNQKVETANSEKCFLEKNDSGTNREYNTVRTFLDYRNVSSIGTHAYISRMNWCLVAKMDEAEIISKNEKDLSFKFFLAMVIILIISGVVGYLYSGTISKPILMLQKGAEEITKGNLTYNVEVKSQDEFAQLAQTFNLMSLRLKESYSVMEKKVRERTQELEKVLFEMQDSRKATLNILEDVEEEKENTQQEKEKLYTILHSIGDGVFVVDKHLRISMINYMVEKISGFNSGELIGQKYDEVLSFVDETGKKYLGGTFIDNAIKSGTTKEMPSHTFLIQKDGTKIPVADSSAPLRNREGEVTGCVIVFRDITREYQVDKAKTEFVSLASHQLRTPLSAINWYAEMLLAGDAGKLKGEQKSFVDEIYNGNQRMVELVNSLLNVSRIELGTLSVDPKPVDFREVSNIVVKELVNEIKTKQLKVEENYAKDLPLINSDPNLTRIIFQNIITNAVKYTPEKGIIKITLEKEKENLLIKISDTGYGIPTDQQSRIFEKLFRADNVREKDTNGSGLGLYLVKSIVEQSDGAVWFESIENKGTTFFVRIPLSGMKKKEGSKTLS
ncbi:MAG: ATP-binding protein, partial [Candidatus Moraniibacteriota bacterium]